MEPELDPKVGKQIRWTKIHLVGNATVARCPGCKAMIAIDDLSAHADWHAGIKDDLFEKYGDE